MSITESVVLGVAFMVIAALFATVGQAGASGYLATMGLAGLDPVMMKPTALALNIVVAAIGTLQFYLAGRLSWRSFYPFGVLGFPFSVMGGAINLPEHIYHPVVGTLLVLAAAQLTRSALMPAKAHFAPPKEPPFLPALLTGSVIGFVSGIVGAGGGIFLAPIILLMNWVELRRAAAVAAAYNFVNSIAALAGAYATLDRLPHELPWWLAAVGVGGIIGARIGSRYLPDRALRYILAFVMSVAGLKLLLT